MGIHFYDSSPDSIDTMKTRLQPALAISRTGVPCMVWAEDALSFVHFVPTSLFTLQLIVPDESVEAATQAITTSLPYQRMLTPIPHWSEFKFIDPATPNCFPNSVALELSIPEGSMSEDDPTDILIHPQSYFQYDTFDHDTTVSLDDFPSDIRFPTRPMFFDISIATILDPPLGYRNQRLHLTLGSFMGYLLTYTLRNQPRIQPNGLLESEHASVLSSLKEENRPYFHKIISRATGKWLDDVKERRVILEKLGRCTPGHPLPRDISLPKRCRIDPIRTTERLQSRAYHSMPSKAAMSGIPYIRWLFRKV